MKRAALSAESLSRIAGQLLGLVGDDPDRLAPEAGEAGDQCLRELRLDVEPLTFVDDLVDHVVHIVGLARGIGDNLKQLLRHALDRIFAFKLGGFCSQLAREI